MAYLQYVLAFSRSCFISMQGDLNKKHFTFILFFSFLFSFLFIFFISLYF